jgi:hypothetical protein
MTLPHEEHHEHVDYNDSEEFHDPWASTEENEEDWGNHPEEHHVDEHGEEDYVDNTVEEHHTPEEETHEEETHEEETHEEETHEEETHEDETHEHEEHEHATIDEINEEQHEQEIHHEVEERADEFVEHHYSINIEEVNAKYEDITHYKDVLYAVEYRLYDLMLNLPYDKEEAQIDPIENLDTAVYYFHELEDCSIGLTVENEQIFKELRFLEATTEEMEGHKTEMLRFYGLLTAYEETNALIPVGGDQCNDIAQTIDILSDDYFNYASKANEAAGHLRNTVEHLNRDLKELKEKIAQKSELNNSERAVFVVTLLPKIVDIQHEFEAYSGSLSVKLDAIHNQREDVKDVVIKYRMCAEHNYQNNETVRI